MRETKQIINPRCKCVLCNVDPCPYDDEEKKLLLIADLGSLYVIFIFSLASIAGLINYYFYPESIGIDLVLCVPLIISVATRIYLSKERKSG